MVREIVASAPGKVNLHLGVGEARADGYHDLVSVFHAVDRRETVRLAVVGEPGAGPVVESMRTTFFVDRPGEDIDGPKNLAWRAVEAVAARAGVALPKVRIEVDKRVFVAGGMAGGSADAAAALVAANALAAEYGAALPPEVLHEFAASLGADVPFALAGGTALGTGRGDELAPMLSRGRLHWVFVNPKIGIPTGEAFSLLDDLRHTNPALVPRLNTAELSQALTAGDATRVAAALHNDLEAPALQMRPVLRGLLEAAGEAGRRAVVSGSGPTVAVLCDDAEHARWAAEHLAAEFDGAEVFVAEGPDGGAVVERVC